MSEKTEILKEINHKLHGVDVLLTMMAIEYGAILFALLFVL